MIAYFRRTGQSFPASKLRYAHKAQIAANNPGNEKRLCASDHNFVRLRSDLLHKGGIAQGEAKPLALTHGVAENSLMREFIGGGIYDYSGRL